MRHFVALIQLFVFLLEHLQTSSFPPPSLSAIQKEREDELAFRDYLDHISSVYATSKERELLIKNGVKETYFEKEKKNELSLASLDCQIKSLAFKFARKLLSGTGSVSELRNIYNGLELAEKCNGTFPDALFQGPGHQKKWHDEGDRKEKQSDKYLVYVDDLSGENHFKGTYREPVKDIQSGIDKCSTLISERYKKCEIFVKDGVYKISQPLTIKENDISLSNYRGGNVVVTSDDIVNIPRWSLFRNSFERFEMVNPIFEGITPKESTQAVLYVGEFPNFLPCDEFCLRSKNCTAYAFFDESAGAYANQCYARQDGIWSTVQHTGVVSGKKVVIYSADLTNYQLNKVDQVFINGRRAVRARFPNGNPETMGLHTVPTGYVQNADKWLPPHNKPDPLEIHIKSPLRTSSLFTDYFLGIGGTVDQFQPPQSYWGVKNPNYGAMYKVPSGLKHAHDLEINVRSWKKAGTGVVHTFPDHHWGNWIYKLDSRDELNETLHWNWGGFQEARGSTKGSEWYVENIFEELDSVNEWFYDEENKMLYYSPNGTDGGLPKTISIPQLPSLLVISGTQHKPVKNVSVKGLTFQHTTQTFLEPYMVPSGGDWSVHRNGVVYVEGSEDVTIQGCTFDSPGGNGLFVSNYNRRTIISHNLFYRLGENGIVLVGDTNLMNGMKGNQPRGVGVLYNIIFENGVWVKQTYAVVQSLACESYIEGNVLFNGPRGGININDGFGGGNRIENNLLFNFVRETSDHGPINTWDRVPYLSQVYDSDATSLDVKENMVHRNFIINNYRSIFPIDHDDGSRFWQDTHNYMIYGGFKDYLGHDLHSLNNVYVYPKEQCLMTVGQSIGHAGYGDLFEQNVCISKRANIYRLGSCNSNLIKLLIPYLNGNKYYTPNATITVQCGSNTWNLTEFQKHGLELGSTVGDLVDDDVVIQWGKSLFGL